MDNQGVEWHQIGCVDWQNEYPYAPAVAFRMAHSSGNLLLNYRVSEAFVRAIAAEDNGKVWEDSCCEFFSSPADDGYYYNMECNCAGTLLVACGQGRENREHAPRQVLEKVSRWSSLERAPFDTKAAPERWDLALVIPLSAYFKHRIESLSGRTVRANFYKCGDKLPQPHFLSWNRISIDKPDFHRPDFFGELFFED